MSSGAPRGQGQVVRLPRGASLSDFADRINANPGFLRQEEEATCVVISCFAFLLSCLCSPC
jgi:hypothetical protein